MNCSAQSYNYHCRLKVRCVRLHDSTPLNSDNSVVTVKTLTLGSCFQYRNFSVVRCQGVDNITELVSHLDLIEDVYTVTLHFHTRSLQMKVKSLNQ